MGETSPDPLKPHTWDIIHRIRSMILRQEVMAWYKLKPFLKAANCTRGWEKNKKESYMSSMRLFKPKLFETLYNIIIYYLYICIYIYIYIHTYIHTKNAANNQHFPTSRRLRVDLGLDNTFVNRRNTNEFMLKMASECAGREVLLFCSWTSFSQSWTGHILRTNDRASLTQVGKRRVGGLRQQWHHFTRKHGKISQTEKEETARSSRSKILKLSQPHLEAAGLLVN